MNDIRDLRQRNRRRKYRRRKTGFLFAVFSFLVILAAVVAAVTVFFKISDIKVTGQTRYTNEQILEASGITTGTNMFLINKFSVINKMFDKLVYLDEVRIRRRLPDTVEIMVTETKPIACVKSAEQYWLIDKRCKILEAIDENKANQTGIITGIELKNPSAGRIADIGDADKLVKLKELLDAADRGGVLAKIKGIHFEKLYDLSMTYDDRFTVILGSAGDYDRKFRFLLNVMQRLSEFDKGTIDLSDPEMARFRPED
ncbi:MAG: FtsQ-type POTRA domain-containing protein [Clostridiales bacterium]|nr:FtsQ-type POTRA domain-containing protein [Clostridiales bacterium]